jgi:hypothetical protein
MNKNEYPDSRFTLFCFKKLQENQQVTNIKGDRDPLFLDAFSAYLQQKISSNFPSSSYINKNRVIDRAIRTIKDGVGINKKLLLLPSIVIKIVEYYNNTPHKAFFNYFTPTQVNNDKEIEAWYIRKQQRKLTDILLLQQRHHFKYQPGNILLIHLPLSKTPQRFSKRRRNFDMLASFIEYVHGNVKVKILNNMNDEVIVPIYYTIFVSVDLEHLPLQYKRLFLF